MSREHESGLGVSSIHQQDTEELKQHIRRSWDTLRATAVELDRRGLYTIITCDPGVEFICVDKDTTVDFEVI